MWSPMKLAALGLVSVIALATAQEFPGLLEALTDAGASRFAQLLQADSSLLDQFTAGKVGTLFAPLDSADNAPIAAIEVKLLARNEATANLTYQCSQDVQDLASLTKPKPIPADPTKPSDGKVVETLNDKANLNGTNQVVVTNPLNITIPFNSTNTTASARRNLLARQNPPFLLTINSGLGNVVNILQADLPFEKCGNSGVIHLVDRYFTVPQLLSETVEALDLTTFGALVEDAGLTDRIDTTPSITVFIPSNEAFAAANISASTPAVAESLLGMVAGDFLGYLPNLENGTRLTTEAGTTLVVLVQGDNVFINGAQIIQSNIILDNGVAHVLGSLPGAPTGTPTTDPLPVATGGSATIASHHMGVAAGIVGLAAAIFNYGVV